jgi:hypothetical protein
MSVLFQSLSGSVFFAIAPYSAGRFSNSSSNPVPTSARVMIPHGSGSATLSRHRFFLTSSGVRLLRVAGARAALAPDEHCCSGRATSCPCHRRCRWRRLGFGVPFEPCPQV